jgi:hypothetical protein
MGKFLCKCENVIRVSGAIPNPIEWLFISDTEYDSYTNPIEPEKLYLKMNSFLKCDQCGRLWVFWDGYDNMPTLYMPESY